MLKSEAGYEREQQTMTDRAKSRSTEVAVQPLVNGPTPESPRFSPPSANAPQHSISLRIEELVLHGFNPTSRYSIGRAVERELRRLFAEQGGNAAIARRWEIENLDGGVFEVQPGSSSELIGTHLAKAIYGGMTR